MADLRFFENSGNKSLAEILEISGATASDERQDRKFQDVASLDMATNADISFLDNIKYKDQLKETNAGACFVVPEFADLVPNGTIALITKNPHKSYALTAQVFYPEIKPKGSISECSVISDSANVGNNVTICAGVVVKDNTIIGDDTWIEENSVISEGCKIGARCRIGVNVTISHSIIKDDVRIYTGTRIGQDGFGFAIDPAGHVKVPQLGRVIINEGCEIGANTTIDRGAGPDTVIGAGTWIDNLVQIAHNVKIGRGCVIVSHVGISGSTEIGDFTVLGGQVGVAGHLKIGSGVQVGAQSGVMKDIPDGEIQLGSPAMKIKDKMRQIAYLNKIVRKR